MSRVRLCRAGVMVAALSVLAGTACAGPDEFGPAPTLPQASTAPHPLGAPITPSAGAAPSAPVAPPTAPSAQVAPPAVPAAPPSQRPAPGLRGQAAVPDRPHTATRTSSPAGKPDRPAQSPSASASPFGPPSRERPGWIQNLIQSTPGRQCDEVPVSERANDRAFEVERLQFEKVCFSGLAEKPAPELVLSVPGGGELGMRAEWDTGFDYDGGIWGWAFQPGLIGDPLIGLGTYRFELFGKADPTVDPGAELTLSGWITVVPATRPRLSLTFDPESEFTERAIRAGGEVAVQFAGYRPGSRHLLTVYGPDAVESGYKPIEDLPEVVVPPDGEATARWESPATAMPGQYGFWVQSAPVQPGACAADLCENFEIEE